MHRSPARRDLGGHAAPQPKRVGGVGAVVVPAAGKHPREAAGGGVELNHGASDSLGKSRVIGAVQRRVQLPLGGAGGIVAAGGAAERHPVSGERRSEHDRASPQSGGGSYSSASAPATTSRISWVISAWRARFIFKRQIVDQPGGVVGRVSHGGHAGAVLGRGRLQQRAEDRDLEVGGQQLGQDLAAVRLLQVGALDLTTGSSPSTSSGTGSSSTTSSRCDSAVRKWW